MACNNGGGKMKQFISFLVITAVILSFAAGAFAEGNGPLEKLGMGIINVVTSPAEIFTSVADNEAGKGMIAGKTHGFIEGIGNFGVKLLTGLIDVATFPIPWPNGYDPMLESSE